MLNVSSSAFDLGCVKTVTRKKCRKYSSPPRASSSRTQYDSAVMTDNRPVIFYTRDDCGSFHTAKTHSGRRDQWEWLAAHLLSLPVLCSQSVRGASS